jgi:hypothetical protein
MPDSETQIQPVRSAPPPASPADRAKALALPPDVCARQIREAFGWKPGEHREVRVLGKGWTSTAIVESPEAAARAVRDLDYGAGIYITMNSIATDAAILQAASPTLRRAGKGDSSTNADINRRSNFVIDLDPDRPTDTGATDEQLNAARELADKIDQELTALGWPMPTRVDSGNGVHLYFRIDLESQSDLPRRALEGLAARFSTPAVKVDMTIHNPARILRAPGSWNTKGDDRALHRVAQLVRVGDDRLLTPEQLEAVATKSVVGASAQSVAAGQAPLTAASSHRDLEAWMRQHAVMHRGREDWSGGGAGAHRWVLDVCPFNPAHDKGEAVITRQANGACGFKCHHNSCSSHGWAEFRRVIEHAHKASKQIAALKRQPYPLHALPQVIRDAVQVQAEITKVDPASIAVPLLTAAIGVVGNGVIVSPWTGWSEAMAVWSMVVAPSGSMKSSTVGFAIKALQDFEASLPRESEEDPKPRILVVDATVEALQPVEAKNPRGIVVARDELAGFLEGIGQYKKSSSSDESYFLSATEGQRYVVDRKTSGSSDIVRHLLSLFGGIQPSVLIRVFGRRGMIESGFGARFMVVWPKRDHIPIAEPPAGSEERIIGVTSRLRRALLALRSIPMVNGAPAVLRFDDDAKGLLSDFANAQQSIGKLLPDISIERACREKSRGWAVRIAGLVCLLRAHAELPVVPDGVAEPEFDLSKLLVGKDDMAKAIELTTWQLGENVRAYAFILGDQDAARLERDHELALEAFDPGAGCATSRELQRTAALKAEEADALFDRLVTAGLWREEHPKPGAAGGRPTKRYSPVGLSSIG